LYCIIFHKIHFIMKKILVPSDFSDTSESALAYAAELAKYLSAGLVLLHVEPIPVMSPEMGLSMYPSLQDMRQDSLNALQNLAGKIKITHAFNGPIEYHSETGNTPDVIIEQVEALGVDLVVMGISGHGSQFIKNLVGSAAVDVSRKIKVPLVIVPPGASFKKIQNISYACDFSQHLANGGALIKVKYLATLFDARLDVVHIVSEGHRMSPEETSVGNFVERSLENSLHKTHVITDSNAGKGLLHFVHQHQADLMIVEPRKHSFFHKLFSTSTTNELVFNSPVPVLVIHEAE
jgi:nucleotide-binding universal stress UspA family protein